MSHRMSRKELQEAVVFLWKMEMAKESWDAYWKMNERAKKIAGKPPRFPEMPTGLELALEEWED